MKHLSHTFLILGLALSNAACEVRFAHNDYFWGFWLVLATTLFFVYVSRTKKRLMESFIDPILLQRVLEGFSLNRQRLKNVLILIVLSLIILTLTEPKYGFEWEDVQRRGVDIVIALDVSDSMLVQDAESGGQLNRLERAKREIADLLVMLEGDRIALVAFAGTAFLECPLTLDYSAARMFLDNIDTDLIPVKGTALGEAITTSVKAFEGSRHASRAIILITDGEDHHGQAIKAAEDAARDGVHIFTIGIGRDEGAPIPNPDGGFRRDRKGELILSKLDERALQKIALATNGRYVRSVTGDVDLEEIYTSGIKATLEDQELGSKRRQHWENRFQWPLGLAILILMIEFIIPQRIRRRVSRGQIA